MQHEKLLNEICVKCEGETQHQNIMSIINNEINTIDCVGLSSFAPIGISNYHKSTDEEEFYLSPDITAVLQILYGGFKCSKSNSSSSSSFNSVSDLYTLVPIIRVETN